MQISPHIHALKIPFRILVAPGITLERFVYVYLIYGKEIILVDNGVSSAADLILGYIKQTGRKPEEITTIIQTHAHPDHIGSTKTIQEASGCVVAAHQDEKEWIEDIELQARERPIPGFHSLVAGSARVDRILADGDYIDLGDGHMIEVIHTPGHSPGSISLFVSEDAALFSGDAIPVPGQIPIFSDLSASIRSIERLKRMPGIRLLLSSWDDPVQGNVVYNRMDDGVQYLKKIQVLVIQAGSQNPVTVSKIIFEDLGLSANDINPLVLRSIEAAIRGSGKRAERSC